MEKQQNQSIHYIIQHMQTYLYEWCYYQYIQMKNYLKDQKYKNAKLIITNSDAFLKYQGEYKQLNQKYVKMLKDQFNSENQKNKERFILESLPVAKLPFISNFDKNQTCLLDLRAQKQLSPQDNFKILIFGGILGDHPPRDRSKPLRDILPQMRHLGSLQLSTDTAVLVSRLILQDKLLLNKIPFVKEPTIKGQNKDGQKTRVQMEGFSYISKELDIDKVQLIEGLDKKQKKKIYIHQGVQRLLLNQDLDSQKIM